MVKDATGHQNVRPSGKGNEIGIGTATREGQFGQYTATVYGRTAQEFIRDNLPAIVAAHESATAKATANQGAPWSPELDEQLKRLFAEGIGQTQIAREMGRSTGGIRARLKKHGLID